jgi:hypothetical protein
MMHFRSPRDRWPVKSLFAIFRGEKANARRSGFEQDEHFFDKRLKDRLRRIGQRSDEG